MAVSGMSLTPTLLTPMTDHSYSQAVINEARYIAHLYEVYPSNDRISRIMDRIHVAVEIATEKANARNTELEAEIKRLDKKRKVAEHALSRWQQASYDTEMRSGHAEEKLARVEEIAQQLRDVLDSEDND